MGVPAAAAGRGDAGHGLFGPASVTWRLGEPVMWVAGIRALYLQALHPRVMRGTWQNTAFADPKQAWGRFVRTTRFVHVRTYGSLAEVERAGRRVRKIHASLRGTDEDGREFRLDEPELLMWVHCTEVGSYADIARRSGLPVRRQAPACRCSGRWSDRRDLSPPGPAPETERCPPAKGRGPKPPDL